MAEQTSPAAGADHGTPPTRQETRKVMLAAGMGHFVEWFEMGIYGTLSTVIALNFFPAGDGASALLSTFAVFAVGFLIRPLGGFFFGPLADRIGRNRVLALIVMLTSGATFAIGVIPTYASIGALATGLLVLARLVQGFAAGGESSSAVTLLFEYAPKNRRGYLTSWVDVFGFAAFVFGSGLVLAMTIALGDTAMQEWAWRVPFLLALPLGLVGLYLRTRLEDSPEFRRMEALGEVTESPVRETFRTGTKAMLVLAGMVVIKAVAHWTLQTYMISYLQDPMGFTTLQSFTAGTICLLVVAVLVPFMGRLSDRVGRKPLLIAGAGGFVLFSYPAFWLMSLHSTVLAIAAMVLLGVLIAAFDGAVSAAMAELFPPRVRSGAIAIPYNISVSLFGGTAPYIATSLVVSTGYDLSPAFYVMGVALISLITVLRIRETAGPRARAGA
ncbi:MHS family proline/betaine transporter-like MFS transporter [Murinocardiopsis flavida]|uniref:MHS family proline/betaine transporter-like MFS transporter n=1 Tax=Murinocardiopsis flavida TaxID=645275 RepID=A0A2P8D6W4_9ACTN|nr:MFS transporter [Murinocardiopsis flavida]PSK92942.1 MHS family proline/betaine transporter-like MFS transporter [Murinocardiopsis flavida]